MIYQVDKQLSILGGIKVGSDEYRQAALTTVKDEYDPYGMKVYLGCSPHPTEEAVHQDVAGVGDEISYAFLKRLVEEMEKNYKEWTKKRGEV